MTSVVSACFFYTIVDGEKDLHGTVHFFLLVLQPPINQSPCPSLIRLIDSHLVVIATYCDHILSERKTVSVLRPWLVASNELPLGRWKTWRVVLARLSFQVHLVEISHMELLWMVFGQSVEDGATGTTDWYNLNQSSKFKWDSSVEQASNGSKRWCPHLVRLGGYAAWALICAGAKFVADAQGHNTLDGRHRTWEETGINWWTLEYFEYFDDDVSASPGNFSFGNNS